MNEKELKRIFDEANDLKEGYPEWSGHTYAAEWDDARDVLISLKDYERQEGNNEQADKITAWLEASIAHESNMDAPSSERLATAEKLETEFWELFDASFDSLADKVNEKAHDDIGE